MLAFTHMIPHSLSVLSTANIESSYAFKFTVLGYMLIFTIEKILFDSHEILHQAVSTQPTSAMHLASSGDGVHSHSHGKREEGEGPGTVKASPLSAKSALVLMLAMGVHRSVTALAAATQLHTDQCD
jgi:hypothetical protein